MILRDILYKLHIVLISVVLVWFISVLSWLSIILMGFSDAELITAGIVVSGILVGAAVIGVLQYFSASSSNRKYLYAILSAVIVFLIALITTTPLSNLPTVLLVIINGMSIVLAAILLVRYTNTSSSKQYTKTIVLNALIWLLRCFTLVFLVFVVLFPLYYMFSISLKPRADLLQNPLDLSINFAKGLNTLFVGYTEVLTTFSFARYIVNSLFVSVITVILALIPAIAGAYAVTRLHFPGRNFFSQSILLIYMFPAIVLALPMYTVFTNLGLRDSLLGLLIVYPSMTIPVALYMLRSYFQSLPVDIEEAALIDGCNRASVILRVTLPLSMPAITSVALYVFMIAWNEFLFVFMMLDNPEIFTLSRAVVSLNSQEVPRQFLAAGSIIITAPVMILFFWFQKLLIGGLTAGSVKG